jgi:hypothetical protein
MFDPGVWQAIQALCKSIVGIASERESYLHLIFGMLTIRIAKTLFCQSCQDTNMKHAAWRYRFIAILEDEVSTLPILISDYEAVCPDPCLD